MSDRLNPIFVYEIRQVVRNRVVSTVLCLYLFLLVLVCGYEFAPIGQEGAANIESGQFGRNLGMTTLVLLFHASLFVTLVFCVSNTIRQGLEEELLFTSPLRWPQIAQGKTQVAALILLLFYCATLPFFTLAWMLRGIDIVTILLILSCGYVLEMIVIRYSTAAFYRCRDLRGLCWMTGLFIVSLPGLLALWGFFMMILLSTVDTGGKELFLMAIVLSTGIGFAALLTFGITSAIFGAREDSKNYDSGEGWFLTAMGSWMIAFFSIMIGVLCLICD